MKNDVEVGSEANVYEPFEGKIKQVEVRQEDDTSADFEN